ncbi:unnamed protein product [Lactuca saligna]|uniref:Myb/SANT-like domain-containing protein n=1 Tax=Lactuca saligna TaxID=75948 RepID=A0AA35Z913_LACSI|nr:unnamed protein product [Lactuca saligna]
MNKQDPFVNVGRKSLVNWIEEMDVAFGDAMSLKSGFSQWYDMFHGISLNGFDWNAETQLIEADDQVWDHLIKPTSSKCWYYLQEIELPEKMLKQQSREMQDEVVKEVETQHQLEPETFETKIMNVVGDVANAMREGNKIFERAYHHKLAGDEIYQELQPMGLEPHEIPGALMYLARNQADVRSSFTCPMNIQKDLLKTMMGTGKR